ncbi:MAG TPA: hypothetical protein VGS79_16655 [Puia sp.]|nr:hypothetical protein [Puia sp.]
MLKQLAAILLIGILFFNWYGYQLLTAYWQQKADKTLVARLDRHDYDDDQLISIKVPLTNIDYYNSSTTFERVDGQIELGGVHYNYVKRRIYKGCLELLCIPNTTVTTLQKAKNEFFRQVNDLQQNQGKKNNSPVKDFSKDYTPSAMDITVPAVVTILPTTQGLLAAAQLPTSYTPTAERPPDDFSLLS